MPRSGLLSASGPAMEVESILTQTRPSRLASKVSVQTSLQRWLSILPFSAKSRRQRQFGQRSGGTLAGQGVCQLEERIAAASKTLPDLMTHLPYCVKVHLSNAPRCFVLRS